MCEASSTHALVIVIVLSGIVTQLEAGQAAHIQTFLVFIAGREEVLFKLFVSILGCSEAVLHVARETLMLKYITSSASSYDHNWYDVVLLLIHT